MAKKAKAKAKGKAKSKADEALEAARQRKYYLSRKDELSEAELKEKEDLEQTMFAAKQASTVFQQNSTGKRHAEGNRIKIAWKSSDMNFLEK